VQTAYASRPWAAELPSAGRPLGAELLGRLARAGVRVAAVTHAAGLSSTGDPAIDAALPLPERFDVPSPTIASIASARAAGGRVIAVGTSVVRALEGCASLHGGALAAGEGVTELVIRRAFEPRIVDGLFTGIHEPSASHFELLQAFAPLELVMEAYAHAESVGYLGHEFGDASLILPA
jgi:S-adenosylmethionine:tRNA ribosyltransferase-isomerase